VQHQQQLQQQRRQSSGHGAQQVTNQISGQSIHAKNVISDTMDDMFVAYNMVQQIMTGAIRPWVRRRKGCRHN
jgi:hypothetical protein